ncbi:MAG TPA: hypothetical protein VE223_03300, partial [Nitrososphaeraceae archaeon]|nr:hypothetical protein [Nitrososphaeraceae archaeon]
AAVCTGNDITTMPSAVTNVPSPILVQRDDLLILEENSTVPIAILSNPVISKTTERIMIIVYIAMLGKVRTTTDNIMEIAPKLICKNRNQVGDLSAIIYFTYVSF